MPDWPKIAEIILGVKLASTYSIPCSMSFRLPKVQVVQYNFSPTGAKDRNMELELRYVNSEKSFGKSLNSDFFMYNLYKNPT